MPGSSYVLRDLSDWRLTRWDLAQRALRVDRSFSCSCNWSHPLLLGRRSSWETPPSPALAIFNMSGSTVLFDAIVFGLFSPLIQVMKITTQNNNF